MYKGAIWGKQIGNPGYTRSYRGEGELFLETARPGVVRFEAEVGVNKYREFAEDVLKRRGSSLKRGLFFLRPHSALLTRGMTLTLAATCEERLGTTSDVPERDRWWMVQDQLFLAFPKLSAEEQVKALLLTTAGEDVLRSLLEVMKPLDETVFDRYFREACRENNARHQYFLLVFAKGSGTPISKRARGLYRVAEVIGVSAGPNGRIREDSSPPGRETHETGG